MAGWNEWVPGANMTLSEVLDAFKSARVGLDVKDKLYWSFYKMVELAIKEGNANFDVEIAKGVYNTLKDRLDAGDAIVTESKNKIEQTQSSLTNGLSGKVDKNGAGQISWAMADQNFRSQVLGNTPPAVVGVNSVSAENIVARSVTNAKLAENYAYVATLADGADINDCIIEGVYFKLANNTVLNAPDNLPQNSQLVISVSRISGFVTVQTLIDYLNPAVEYIRTVSSGAGTAWIKRNMSPVEKSNLGDILKNSLPNFLINSSESADYDLIKKLSAIKDIKLIGIDSNTPVKIWFLSRGYKLEGETPWNHRIYLGKKVNGVWSKLLDTTSTYTVEEVTDGLTKIEVIDGEVQLNLTIDYRQIPYGERIIDGTFLTDEPSFVINPQNVKLTDEPENPFPDDFEVYDQSLNTFDSVTFASLSTDVFEVGGELPAGTLASPPAGLLSGDMWADTTDSATHPVLRVKL